MANYVICNSAGVIECGFTEATARTVRPFADAGKTVIEVPEREWGNLDVLQAYANKTTGLAPTLRRIAVIEGGTVTNLILDYSERADRREAPAEVKIGWRYDEVNGFRAPQEVTRR